MKSNCRTLRFESVAYMMLTLNKLSECNVVLNDDFNTALKVVLIVISFQYLNEMQF